MIDKATVEKIKATADIVEVVSDYVHLTRRGSNYMGLCPFHNERTPSFSVNRSRNFCYCFSCHKGGSPLNFIMEKEGLSYHDALLHLANRYGIKVEERELTDEERRQQSEREAMLVVNEWAMNLFIQNMNETEEGRNIGLQYFYQRGVTDEAITKFRLGYAIDKANDLVEKAVKAGYDLNVLKAVGLVGESKEGRLYDRFRGRVIYPILNSAGKVIAFGGRDLKGGPAKYINSPESEIYRKSNELYGIYQAKNAISRSEICFLVEGYMDVIGMWQSGMENVLSSSGTALTTGQIALIHRFAKEVILIYDGDAAGIKAALRGIDMLLAQRLTLKILLLPDGDDPDSFARKHTPEEFREFVAQNAVDVIQFKTQVLMKDASRDPVRRSEAIHSIVQSIANIPDKIQRIAYIQQCSSLLNIPENVILAEAEKARVKVVENWKRERERKNLERDFPSTVNSALSNDIGSAKDVNQEIKSQHSHIAQDSHTAPFEKEVIRYCIKYGMAIICSAADVEGLEKDLSVVEYIRDELNFDSISFSIPTYSDIFTEVLEMLPRFNDEFEKFISNVTDNIESLRREGYDEIASKNLSTARIEVEEAHLEERLTKHYNEVLKEFIVDYPGRMLASHENDDIRKTVTDLISEKVFLSKRFRQMSETSSEFDRISELVPRGLAEWKDGILHQRLLSINARMAQASIDNNNELLQDLQNQAFHIIQSRREAAKSIGDRIIATRR